MTEPKVLREGKFDPKVKKYWLLSPTIAFTLTIVLIPIIPIYLIIASLIIDRWLAALQCTLTERTLIIKKGLLNKVESTVPLEKITDLQLYQGPVMRFMGLKGFRVETAGQSSGAGSYLVNMIGIIDTDEFRTAVLEQRDRHTMSNAPTATATPAPSPVNSDELTAIARDIREALGRIENKLDSKAE